MKAIKRVEIVIESDFLPRMISILDKNQINGYTIIRNASGKGDKGLRDGYGLTDVFQNIYLLISCSEEELERIKEPVRLLLERVGGMCLVSDAQWLIHE
ncbi:MAG: P-II family nitrogen regulator [Cyclobacteriaceae bacterium]